MNDKELLYLAAKAAGIEITFEHGFPQRTELFRGHLINYFDWNPLIDDGDSLRLLVELKMDINIDNEGITVWYYNGNSEVEAIGEGAIDGDFLSATKRAIVLAAAEIGKSL